MAENELNDEAGHVAPDAETAERYRSLFQYGVAGAARTTLDGEILEVNRSLARIFGVDDPSVLEGENISAFYRSPEVRTALVQRVLSEGTVENVDVPFRRTDGTEGVVLFNARLVDEEDGDQPVIWATVIDITERKRVERARRHLSSLVEHSEDAIIAKSLDGRIETWNAAAERMYGWTAEEAIGEPATMLVPDDVKAEFEALLEAAAGGELVQGREIERVRKDGTRFPISLTLSPIRGADGELIGISGIDRDITERKRVERARRRLSSLVEHSEDAIIAKSLDGRIETWNAAAERMYGWTAEEAIGEPATMLVPDDVKAEFEALLEAAAGGELVQGREIERVRKDGTRFPISLTLSPIRGADGELIGISGIDRDITELRRYREELEELVRERTRELEEREAALQRAEKLEAIGKLTGGVAHDFNNLLHVIDAHLHFLRRAVAGSPETEQRLEAASEAVERGAELTSQLLSFARRQPLEPRVVDPARLLEEMGGMIRRTTSESIEIRTEVEGDLWNTVVDPHRLENVLLNLVVNARDAMEGEGRLTIELENTRLDESYAESRADVTPGRYVCLAVSDTGRGMSEEEQERAFEPFFTTKGEEKGTGLGLSMAYGFVKQSGGHIALYGEPGEGTTVRLYLPHTPEAEERIADDGEDAAPASAGGGDETVLVVEDDDDVRATAVEMLEELGYQVLEAIDGESALTVLQSGVEVDLLFTDVVMPGPVRSTELAEQARALFPDLKVLFTSGYTENAIVHQGRLDPGVRLLDKPYGQEELARAVRRTLESETETEAPAGTADREPDADAADGSEAGDPGTDDGPRGGARSSADDDERPDASALRVLVVEDEVLVQQFVRDVLEGLGHEVLGVRDAAAATAAAEEHEFDVLLTDISLPGRTGVELARTLRERRPGLSVILATGYVQDADPDGDLPDAVHLSKPFRPGDLEDALAEAV